MNRTLMDKVRCLLIQSGLPKTFWVEATCMAAYLINRSPSTAIEKKTPMEMWSGRPSADKSVEELQVEVELQRLNNHTLKEDQTDNEAEEEDIHEPLTYQEAVACEDNSKWKAAMKEEMDSLRKNKTWELV
nr:retrovirus-related Pol polyprotein from transposon TNT 1-94 [Tanacetum cinerariifolium]